LGTDYTTLAPRQRAAGLTAGAGGVAASPGYSTPCPDEAMDGSRQDTTGTAKDSENEASANVSVNS
jgi:hypothetical protein